MIKTLTFLMSFVFCCCCFAKDTVAICCIFRDDSKYLPEWIEFHERQGVSHFFLYNNLSRDDWNKSLEKYIQSGLVEVIDWPYDYFDGVDWNVIQCNSYKDGAKRASGRYTWCAFLDSDEFLFCMDGTTLPKFLSKYKSHPGVMVNWVMYGTSDVTKIPEGEKMLKHLVKRAPMDSDYHRIFKTIARPDQIRECINPHWFIYDRNHRAVDENNITKDPSEMTAISVNKIRINHYWSRDIEFFYSVKLSRRSKWYNEYERVLRLEREMNVIYDPILVDR